jgi:pimeloyl-ACP methyl ester carboxylesterase
MSQERSLQTAGITFSYRETGPAEGTPVLLLHGFPDAANAWDDLVSLLRPEKRKLRLLVLSMRGYGGTMIRQENLVTGQEAALTQDVLSFADALGLGRFLLVGHDWGARAAFNLAAIAPERVLGLLALSSPYVMYGGRDLPPAQVQHYWYQWFFQTAQGEKALRTRAVELCEHIWRVWSPTWKFSRRQLEQTAAFWANPQFVTVVLGSYRHRYGNELGKPAYQALQDQIEARPKISVPTLFGYGTHDECVLPAASEDLKRYFEGWFERTAIKGVGHFPHREDPDAVLKLFDRLWKKVRPA